MFRLSAFKHLCALVTLCTYVASANADYSCSDKSLLTVKLAADKAGSSCSKAESNLTAKSRKLAALDERIATASSDAEKKRLAVSRKAQLKFVLSAQKSRNQSCQKSGDAYKKSLAARAFCDTYFPKVISEEVCNQGSVRIATATNVEFVCIRETTNSSTGCTKISENYYDSKALFNSRKAIYKRQRDTKILYSGKSNPEGVYQINLSQVGLPGTCG